MIFQSKPHNEWLMIAPPAKTLSLFFFLLSKNSSNPRIFNSPFFESGFPASSNTHSDVSVNNSGEREACISLPFSSSSHFLSASMAQPCKLSLLSVGTSRMLEPMPLMQLPSNEISESFGRPVRGGRRPHMPQLSRTSVTKLIKLSLKTASGTPPRLLLSDKQSVVNVVGSPFIQDTPVK
eukprot:21549_1